MRITPENVIELKENEIFIFGSNKEGNHYSGSARIAYEKFGAKWGIGYGISGQSYAINTMSGLERIKSQIPVFLKYVNANKDKNFLVTAIGTGIAGFTPKQIAPLFKETIELENVYLPQSFINIIRGE